MVSPKVPNSLSIKKLNLPINSAALGVLIAKEVNAFTTTLEHPSGSSTDTFLFSSNAYAVQTRAGEKEDLRLNVALNENLLNVFRALVQQVQTSTSDTRKIQLVEMDGNPHFRVDLEEGRVVFENLDPMVNK